ncbi:replicative DNA helicase [Macrococcus equi]|uniref:replicative DNA helicase n=1 Tax=Macrococcus equi TaxID=3395462 RepID=UPI0039BE9E7A
MNYINNEHLLIGALIKYPELYSNLKIESYMLLDPYAINFIEYINNRGKIDVNEIYKKAVNENNAFMPPELIKDLKKETFISKNHFTQYQIDILEAFKQRELLNIANEIHQSNGKVKYIDVKDKIDNLISLNINNRKNSDEALLEILDEVTLEKQPKLYKTGFKQIDNLIGGFEPSQLVVIAARPSVGKTAFALNMAIKQAENGNNVTVFSLETTTKKINQRMLSTLGKIQLSKFRIPESFLPDEIQKIYIAVEKLKKLNINIVDDSKATPLTIRQELIKMSEKSENNIIIIDFLTLMKSDSNIKDRRLEIEDISRKLKVMAKEFNCTIILLSQLSRGVESRNDKRPMMSDLREAGGIEQDADMIFLLYREDYYNKPIEVNTFSKSEIECIIAKNKDGATGTALLDFYKSVQGFY